MSELRLNVVTREWVIIAPERASRPSDAVPSRRHLSLPPHDPACPFCPGNEHMTAAEVERCESSPGTWRTRVVLNMYPVLSRNSSGIKPHHDGLMHAVNGFGTHEVVIDSPHHNLSIAQLALEDVACVLRAYRSRYRALRADPEIAHIIVFKNHGFSAGTSLAHPHSQIVGTPVVSHQVRERIRTMEDHLALFGECVICRLIDEEIAQGVRIVHTSPSFVAMVPYAALSSYHVWLFPRRHMAWFGDIGDDELSDLAKTLHTVMRKVYRGLGNPDYNFLIRSAPRTCTNEQYHWYLSIVPRIGQAAGFELGSGIYVNPTLPEEAARFLRSVDTDDAPV